MRMGPDGLVRVTEGIDIYDMQGPLADLVGWAQKIVDSIPDASRETATIEVEDGAAYVEFLRPATAYELELVEREKKAKEDQERKTLGRLLEKYGVPGLETHERNEGNDDP